MTGKSQIWLLKTEFYKIKQSYNHIRTNKILERLTFYNNMLKASYKKMQKTGIKNGGKIIS